MRGLVVHQDARYARNRECPEGLNKHPVHDFVVHQDARYVRNRECPKGLNNVPCVIWSCIKMHATNEIVNYAFEVNHSCNRYNKKPVLSVSQSQVFLIALWQYYCFIPPNAPRD